jgi:hypothetical protein
VKSVVSAAQAAKGEVKALKLQHRDVTMEKTKHYAVSLSKKE